MPAVLLLLVVVVADRYLKFFARTNSELDFLSVGGLFHITSTINISGPLGLPLPADIFFILTIILSALLLGLIVVETSQIDKVLTGGVILGILSNSYDRFMYGYVIDTFQFMGLAFNVADVLIVIGVAVVLWRKIFEFRVSSSTSRNELSGLDSTETFES